MTDDWARKFHQDDAALRGLHLTDHQAHLAADLHHHDYDERPHQLLRLHHAGHLTGDLATYLVPETWRYRLDTCRIPASDWRGLFATTRYTHTFTLATPPRWPLHLYRGATTANREGLAWTTRLDQARYFAHTRQAPGTQARIWVATVPPDRLFAYLGGTEQEHVLDARGLTIREINPQTRNHRLAARLPAARPWHRPPRSDDSTPSPASP